MGAGLNLAALKSDGTEFPAEISLGQVRMLDKAFTIAAIRDVTERRQTQVALEVAYKELESFSYSIAHDLRAPLRGMNGFAQALIEDYADQLDSDGLDFLNEIRNNAIRMGELIDALLSLSRVARSRLHVERVDLGALARSIALRCAQNDPTRPVDLVIHDRLFARGDVALLRTLMENLVLNAWKFTRDTANARIEIGSKTQEDGVVFFVRDNGAGFDMAHASKLFGAFQRLHSEKDFPGTGIGLATAQRIVHRHGGRIWAEGERGAGAMFAFTLPADTKEARE
jgi:light-regulated signal transduction histidine kinase (bacteriophytochrome)